MTVETDLPWVIQWRRSLLESRVPAMRRWVLVALSLYGDRDGKNIWPSTVELARAAGLSRHRTEGHLREAETDGWIRRRSRGVGGKGWRRMEYVLTVPAPVVATERVDDTEKVATERANDPLMVATKRTDGCNGALHERSTERVSSGGVTLHAHVGAGTREKASDTRTAATTDSAETYHPEDLRRIAAGLPPRPAAVRAAEAATLTTDDEGFKV